MTWGNAYYGHDIKADCKSDSAKKWLELLGKQHPDLQKQVGLAVRQWNNTLRDLLRNETGLRLSVGDEITQVQIKVVDGISPPLMWVLSDYDKYAELLLHEKNLQDAVRGLDIAEEHFEALCDLTQFEYPNQEDFYYLGGWLKDALNRLKSLDIEQRLREINEDILGAYFFNRQRIEIYWASIGIFANRLGVSVEGLTVVTLAHELAHAYTHLGKDIDGIVWNTEYFADTDTPLVEGMAQFYTRAICRKLAARFPAALTAFEALLKLQSEPYTHFAEWVKEHPHQGEVVRFSMIQCRSSNIRHYGHFLQVLENQRM